MTNLEKLEKIFPEVITETLDADGNLIRAVDFERFKEIFSGEINDEHEAYEFNFVGKQKARFEAYKRIYKTLRPIISESRDFDSTGNIYIEGDNLDALKILAESYLGKVKMIYIDPPYNTGNDFIYRDDFSQSAKEFDEDNFDETGNRLFANKESRGRFHSDWCAMIYSRLLIAKHFLSNDGVIFISIDDHEQANLKKICDEVFGEKNFVGTYIKQSKIGGGSDSKFLVKEHEYCIVYSKDIDSTEEMFIPHDEEYLKRYKETDETGKFFWDTYARPALQLKAKDSLNYPITCPDGTIIQTRWIRSKERFQKDLRDGVVKFTKKNDGTWSIQFKQYLNADGKKPRSMTMDFGGNQESKNELTELFGTYKFFSYPKSVKFLKSIISTLTDKNSIVLDFFSGSATTAHAVMELNAQDGGNRKFILVQLPEKMPENSEARRAGYLSICDIGKERIRRAGDKLKAAHPNLDTGFRVFKIDSSNFLPLPTDYEQLILMVENIKDDRDAYDLFFGTLLDMGFTLDKKFSEEILDGYKILSYDGEILGCFDKNIRAETFRKLAGRKPRKIIFRDCCFISSSDKINALEFFKYFAPDTKVKVL